MSEGVQLSDSVHPLSYTVAKFLYNSKIFSNFTTSSSHKNHKTILINH